MCVVLLMQAASFMKPAPKIHPIQVAPPRHTFACQCSTHHPQIQEEEEAGHQGNQVLHRKKPEGREGNRLEAGLGRTAGLEQPAGLEYKAGPEQLAGPEQPAGLFSRPGLEAGSHPSSNTQEAQNFVRWVMQVTSLQKKEWE